MESLTLSPDGQAVNAEKKLDWKTPRYLRGRLSSDYRSSSSKHRRVVYAEVYSAYSDAELATFPFATAMTSDETSDSPPKTRIDLIRHLAMTEESRTFHPFARLPGELQLRVFQMAIAEIPINEKSHGPPIPQVPALALVSPGLTKVILPLFYEHVTIELVYSSGLPRHSEQQKRVDDGKEFLSRVTAQECRLIRNLDITLSIPQGLDIERKITFELRFNRFARKRDRVLRIFRAKGVWGKPIQDGSPRALALAEAREMVNGIADRPYDQRGLRTTDIPPLVAKLWKVNASSPVVGDTTRGIGDPPVVGKTLTHDASGRKINKTTPAYEMMFGVQYLV